MAMSLPKQEKPMAVIAVIGFSRLIETSSIAHAMP
jgi:hypothetical protein